MQGDDPDHLKSAACAKHFAVHSGPEAIRHEFDAKASKHDMYDTYSVSYTHLESLDEIRHGNNSNWWHVYKSNKFIINAFKYANKYTPSDVELYYNDFGETDNIKSEGTIKLISDVKSRRV